MRRGAGPTTHPRTGSRWPPGRSAGDQRISDAASSPREMMGQERSHASGSLIAVSVDEGGVTMWHRLMLIGVFAGGTASGAEGRIEPKADAELHRMSDYLAGLDTFRVDGSSVDETKVNKDGQKMQTLSESKF